MPGRLPTRTQILDVVASEDHAFHAREVASRLNVDESSYPGLLRMLDDLVFEGVLAIRPGHKYKVPKKGLPRGEEREGNLTVNPRGFGFVASPTATGDDVFVPADALKGAMHGDRVKVHIRARGSRGPEGEIVEVLTRGNTRVGGILRRRGKSAWLEPDDNRIRGPITLPSAIDLRDGEGNSGSDGDAAVVTVTRFPELPDETPVGKLEAVLGKPGELSVEIAKVLLLERIDELHSPEAVAEAEAYGEEVPESMLEGREDLTHLPLPTIDPEDARDHDDAVWVERRGDGYRAWIAIADVSSYVRPGTKLDEEAKGRGCSIYLPDRAIPMLPRALSSNLCSLLPGVVRLCLCVEADLDGGGHVQKVRLIRGFMKSRAKLSYGNVARALRLSDTAARSDDAEAMKDDLAVAYELSRMLRSRRMKRGALDFELPEPKILIDKATGLPTDVQRRTEDAGVKKAYQLIEELMLLANECVAQWIAERNLTTIFRVHLPPDELKLERFATMCDELGIPYDVEATQDPKKLSKLLKSFNTHPMANVLNMLLLRSMKQAAYDVSNLGHFGLASQAYLHFTSPIRRYPDLVVHRRVHEVLLEQRIRQGDKAHEELVEAATLASSAERRAMEIEREVVDLYRAVLMRDRIGDVFEGGVTGMTGSGLFVSLDAPFVDVLVRYEDLGLDRYELDEDGLRVVASRSGEVIRLADRMLVEIADVAIMRRMVLGRRLVGARAIDDDERPRRGATRRRVFEADGSIGRSRVERRGRAADTGSLGRNAKGEAKRRVRSTSGAAEARAHAEPAFAEDERAPTSRLGKPSKGKKLSQKAKKEKRAKANGAEKAGKATKFGKSSKPSKTAKPAKHKKAKATKGKASGAKSRAKKGGR